MYILLIYTIFTTIYILLYIYYIYTIYTIYYTIYYIYYIYTLYIYYIYYIYTIYRYILYIYYIYTIYIYSIYGDHDIQRLYLHTHLSSFYVYTSAAQAPHQTLCSQMLVALLDQGMRALVGEPPMPNISEKSYYIYIYITRGLTFAWNQRNSIRDCNLLCCFRACFSHTASMRNIDITCVSWHFCT